MATDPAQSNRLPGLDGLRAIAVVFVIIWHTGGTNHIRLFQYIGRFCNGEFGVRIFFVLSGFLITWLLLSEERKRGRFNLKLFYIRRGFRILPPAFTYLLAMTVLAIIGVIFVTWQDIAASALFVRSFFQQNTPNPPFTPLPPFHDETSHYWSLAVEEQFYLVWPALLFLLRGNARITAALCIIIASTVGAWILYHLNINPLQHYFAYVTGFTEILIGCVLALMRDDPRLGRYLRAGILQYALIPYLAFALAVGINILPTATIAKPFLEAGCFALCINQLVENHGGITQAFLDFTPIAWIGKLSYSIYLWQQFFCWCTTTTVLPWYRQFPQNLALTLACASASYYLIEQPSLRLRDALLARKHAVRKLPQQEPVAPA